MTRLVPGDKAPDFNLADPDGRKHQLSEYRGRSLVLYFYPSAMTPGCTKQACDFRDNLAVLEGSGYEVVGISPDKPERVAKFIERDRLPFTMLCDPDHEVMGAYGTWDKKSLYGKIVTGVVRSTFVIDPQGKIVLAQYGVKATGHVARLLRELELSK